MSYWKWQQNLFLSFGLPDLVDSKYLLFAHNFSKLYIIYIIIIANLVPDCIQKKRKGDMYVLQVLGHMGEDNKYVCLLSFNSQVKCFLSEEVSGLLRILCSSIC